MSPATAPTWTLPGIPAPLQGTGTLAGFGLFDDDEIADDTAAPAAVAVAVPGPLASVAAATTVATEHSVAPDDTDRSWLLPAHETTPAPTAWAATAPTASTEVGAIDAAWTRADSGWTASDPTAAATAELAHLADLHAPSEEPDHSPATLQDVIAAVRGREQAPWAIASEPAAPTESDPVLADAVTTTPFPRGEHTAHQHEAHELAPREHHSPLAAIIREQEPVATAPETHEPEPDAARFDADAFAASLIEESEAEADDQPRRRGRWGKKASKAADPAAPVATTEAPATEKPAKAPKPTKAEKPAKADRSAKAAAARRGRKADQAAMFERMTAPRPGSSAPAPLPIEATVEECDPFVIDHVADAPTTTDRGATASEAKAGRRAKRAADEKRTDKPSAKTTRRRLGRRTAEETDMLDRLQGRFPSSAPTAVVEDVPAGPAVSGELDSPTFDSPTFDSPTFDSPTFDENPVDQPAFASDAVAHDEHDAPTFDTPTFDVTPGTSWGAEESTTERAPSRSIFAKTTPRPAEPLTGGKALALRVTAVVCIAGGVLIGWRTLHPGTSDTTTTPAPTTVAAETAATVVAEAPATIAEPPAADTVPVDAAAVIDPNAAVDPNAPIDPTASADPNAASTGSGDFFEAPKDYSAR